MVQMEGRRFTAPAKKAPQGRVRDSLDSDDLNAPLIPIPPSFRFLREKANPDMIYPWSPTMAERSDLVEGYNPQTEANQLRKIDSDALDPLPLDEQMLRRQLAALDAFR